MKVRSDIMKLSKSMHTWVGVCSGILLFICFFAGGLTMFQHQFSRWATPNQQVMPSISIDQYDTLIEKVQQQYPATEKGFTLNFNSNEYHNAPLTWSEKTRRDGFNTHQHHWMASLNENNELIVREENLSKVGWLIEQLHETAGIPGLLGHHTLGVYVMGIVSVLYFLALMSGLIILLPTLVKDYFVIRPGKNKKRFWLDTHNVVGITSLPFHIIICMSVFVFAFHDQIYDSFSELALNGKPVFPRNPPTMVDVQQTQIKIQPMLQKIQNVAPEYRVDYIQLNNLNTPEKATARIALYSPDQVLRGANQDFMRMNPYAVENFDHKGINTQTSVPDKIINSLFSLHFGSYGGDAIRWIYLILGIGGAFLFYSGNLLWVETRARKQKRAEDAIPTQRKDVVFLANLSIGACLGCIIAIFATLLLSRWSYAFMGLSSLNQFFMWSYYSIFILSIAYCFIRGYAKVLTEFLLGLAFIFLLIPITSCIAYLLPQTGLWVHSGDVLYIDLGCFISALLFLRFYKQAKLRQQHAKQGELWFANAKN